MEQQPDIPARPSAPQRLPGRIIRGIRHVAVRRFTRRDLVVVLVVITVDLATKLAALAFLPYGRTLPLAGGLSFHLLYNDSGSNAAFQVLGYGGSGIVLAVSIAMLLLGTIVLLANRFIRPMLLRAACYAVFLAGLSYLLPGIMPLTRGIRLAPWPVTVFRYLGPIFCAAAILAVTRDTRSRFLWAVYLGGGLGNFLGCFYPPFAIIDFIWLSGFGSPLGTAVFNLADVAVSVAVVAVILYAPVWCVIGLVRRVRARCRGRQDVHGTDPSGGADGIANGDGLGAGERPDGAGPSGGT